MKIKKEMEMKTLMKEMMVLAALIMIWQTANAGIVTGRITEKGTGEALVGATVMTTDGVHGVATV